MMAFMRRNWPRWVPWLALLALWQGLSLRLPSVLLPSPWETAVTLWHLLGSRTFYLNLSLTLARAAVGFGLSVSLGVLIGLGMGLWETAYQALRPVMVLSTNVPPIAWVALLVIWLGLGNGPPLLVILTTTMPLVAVHVAEGVRELDPALLEMAESFGLSLRTRLRHVVLPALSGRIFAATLLALGFTWRALVMAEFLGSTSGLGYRLAWARQNLETDRVLAYLIVIVALSLGAEAGLRRLFRALRPWEQGVHPEMGERPHRHEDGHWHTHPPLPPTEWS